MRSHQESSSPSNPPIILMSVIISIIKRWFSPKKLMPHGFGDKVILLPSFLLTHPFRWSSIDSEHDVTRKNDDKRRILCKIKVIISQSLSLVNMISSDIIRSGTIAEFIKRDSIHFYSFSHHNHPFHDGGKCLYPHFDHHITWSPLIIRIVIEMRNIGNLPFRMSYKTFSRSVNFHKPFLSPSLPLFMMQSSSSHTFDFFHS